MGDFKVIVSKKKRRTPNHNTKLEHCLHKSDVISSTQVRSSSKESVVQRINSAKEDIRNSEFFKLFSQDLLKESRDLENIDIVTYGLGNFSQCVSSRYQFAFILVLKDLCKGSLLLYDPVFSAEELEIIKHFDCFIIAENEEGKREIDQRTIFFLPHCPKQLLNNLLWKNWTASLKHCIIVGNSIKNIVESHSDRFLKQNLTYVFYASSFVKEITINNCFKYSDIFNDLSIQFFLEQNISELNNTVSELNKEPSYEKEDIEFITSSLINCFSIKQ